MAPESEKPEGALGDVLEFMRLLWAVDHGLQRRSKRMDSEHGVTGPQRLVVRIVGRFPGIGAKRVAEILHVHPSTLTGILQRLERRGLVARKSDPRDARRALFGLTAKGRKVNQLRSGTVEQSIQRVLARAPGDVAAAQRMLAQLARELSQQRDP